jgi:histidinol-phosphate phosphatase family protein
MENRAYVFLDRDGTLVEDPGYLHRLEDYVLLPGVVEALASLQRAGYRLAVVTNQSGIGRGLFDAAAFETIQERLRDDLARGGVELDASYFCPHLPDAGCRCRKPATELLERAVRELGADLHTSWVIGDKPSDMQLAQNAGCRGVYVLTGQGVAGRDAVAPAVHVTADLTAAATWIASQVGPK